MHDYVVIRVVHSNSTHSNKNKVMNKEDRRGQIQCQPALQDEGKGKK